VRVRLAFSGVNPSCLAIGADHREGRDLARLHRTKFDRSHRAQAFAVEQLFRGSAGSPST
jgi:hypothetical protein